MRGHADMQNNLSPEHHTADLRLPKILHVCLGQASSDICAAVDSPTLEAKHLPQLASDRGIDSLFQNQ